MKNYIISRISENDTWAITHLGKPVPSRADYLKLPEIERSNFFSPTEVAKIVAQVVPTGNQYRLVSEDEIGQYRKQPVSVMESLTQRIDRLHTLTRCRLDAFAREKGFDSIHAAASYAGNVDDYSDPVIKGYVADGNRAKQTMLQTWAAGLALINQYQAGEIEELTDDQFITALPVLSWDY